MERKIGHCIAQGAATISAAEPWNELLPAISQAACSVSPGP